MPEITDSFLRDQLLARRQRLESAASAAAPQDGVAQLLNEVDAALTRMHRLRHTHDRVNIIYSHTGDQAQLAASEAV